MIINNDNFTIEIRDLDVEVQVKNHKIGLELCQWFSENTAADLYHIRLDHIVGVESFGLQLSKSELAHFKLVWC